MAEAPVGNVNDIANLAGDLVGQRVQHRLPGLQIAFANDPFDEESRSPRRMISVFSINKKESPPPVKEAGFRINGYG